MGGITVRMKDTWKHPPSVTGRYSPAMTFGAVLVTEDSVQPIQSELAHGPIVLDTTWVTSVGQNAAPCGDRSEQAPHSSEGRDFQNVYGVFGANRMNGRPVVCTFAEVGKQRLGQCCSENQ